MEQGAADVDRSAADEAAHPSRSPAPQTPEQYMMFVQGTAGNAAATRLAAMGGPMVLRQPLGTDPDAPADVLPPPRVVTWSTDKFEIAFARTGGSFDPRFEFQVRYLGDHTILGDPTTRVAMGVGTKQLDARMLAMDDTSLTVDLYGDGKRIVQIRDNAAMSPGAPGRSHSFGLWVDQQNISSTTTTILDPKAGPADLTVAPVRENPGANPELIGKGFGADGWQGFLDGDGDQDKELQLTLKMAAGTPDRALAVTVVQRSSGQARSAVLPIPAGASPDFLMPMVRQVTDGHAPTRLQLFMGPEPALLLSPGRHSEGASTYGLTLGGQTTDLTFPPEQARRKIAGAEAPEVAGGIVAFDITLGAYRDPFRLSFKKFQAESKITFGLSVLNDGVASDTVGAELPVTGSVRYGLVNTGETSIGVDITGDGTPDLQLFDRLTSPPENEGMGPPALARNHQVRILGPALGGERTYDFQFRNGRLRGANNVSGAVNREAGRNAEAVSSLAEQAKTTTLDDSLDQVEVALLAMRRRAAARKLLSQAAFDANLALWQVLVRIRAEVKTGVPAALKNEAVAAADTFVTEVVNDFQARGESPPRSTGFVAEALRTGNWSASLTLYNGATGALDTALRARMEKEGGESDKDLVESKQLGTLRSELMEIPRDGRQVLRVAGTYHPDEKFSTEQGYVSMVPLQLYAWKDDDEWKLKDVTNPAKPYTYDVDAKDGETVPPLRLLNELNDPDHFPCGVINIQIPGGDAGQVAVQDRLTWKKFFTYLGVSLAVIGLTLSVIASAGATSAAVPAAWALGASAIAGATAAGIDLVEHIQQDNLDARTAVLDLAQIAAGIATAGALAAGRIVVAAGSAPAAARWTGAWAQAAMLSQRAYVPLVLGAGASDVVTVAVMAEGTLRQIEAVEKSNALPEEKSRAKLLLLVQAATMAGLTALQFKGIGGPLGRGETLVLSPGPEGVPVVSTAVRAETLIVDSNIAIALRKRAALAELKPGEVPDPKMKLQPGEEKALAVYDSMHPADTRIADRSIGETGTAERGFAVGVDRAGKEYQEVLAALEDVNVGAKKGAADRTIVADAYFAVGEPGVTPTLATMDENVYKKMWALKVKHENAEPLVDLIRKNAVKGQAADVGLPDLFPDGFTVTIKTASMTAPRTVKVLPMPKVKKSGLAKPKP